MIAREAAEDRGNTTRSLTSTIGKESAEDHDNTSRGFTISNRIDNRVLSFGCYWDIEIPRARVRIFRGRSRPTVKRIFEKARPRRITLEIRQPSVTRGVVVKNKKKLQEIFDKRPEESQKEMMESASLLESERLELRIYKPIQQQTQHSMRQSSPKQRMQNTADHEYNHIQYQYKERYHYPLDTIQLLETSSSTCVLKLGAGEETALRKFRFRNDSDKSSFLSLLKHLESLGEKRKKLAIDKLPTRPHQVPRKTLARFAIKPALHLQNISAHTSGYLSVDEANSIDQVEKPTPSFPINILVEIVSVTNLLVDDKAGVLVAVQDGAEVIHRTAKIPNTYVSILHFTMLIRLPF